MFGELAKSKAVFALVLPFLAAVSNLFFLADMSAISDMEKIPLSSINKNIMTISNFYIVELDAIYLKFIDYCT
ncbi:MAG: hypothetical protein A3G95_05935 [Flavobacteria bacterium RIFCSPLOWO2_12_FULL_31_7]|nr:MAG: hypothetical protein A3G95_05935 [Flavobacteria bacterium RIFCSPLOWO2_12_FULL_31_7]